jgi:hypothetical protein
MCTHNARRIWRWFAAASTGTEHYGEPAGEPNTLATRCTEVHSIEPLTSCNQAHSHDRERGRRARSA